MGSSIPPSGPPQPTGPIWPPSTPAGQPAALTAPSVATAQASQATPPSANVGRRAVILAAAIAAAAVATPFVVEKGVELAEAEAGAFLQRELGDLEDVALDEAVQVAELTRQVVKLFVIPLATFLTTISGDGLQALANTTQTAINALESVHLPTDGLPGLESLLLAWKANEAQLPITLGQLTDTDINGAETYLTALKAKVNSSKPL